MTETKNARTGNPAASPVENTKYEMPKLGSMEVPAAIHEIADKGIAHTKDTFKNAKAATEEASHLLQNTFTAATKGATDYNLKVIEIARINTNAAFDYAHELLGVKSLSEFVELSTAGARKQFEAMTAQTKELTTLAQKVTIETAMSHSRPESLERSTRLPDNFGLAGWAANRDRPVEASINNNLPPPARPGLGYLFGAIVVVMGVMAIMMFKGSVS